jgi:hypothetical protein
MRSIGLSPSRMGTAELSQFEMLSGWIRRASRSTSPQRFIESKRKPRDSQQVDTTWQYVNVKGGPDRRFKNNRQFPVMLYGKVDLSAPSGLHWLLQFSRAPLAEQLAQTLSGAPSTQKPMPSPLPPVPETVDADS